MPVLLASGWSPRTPTERNALANLADGLAFVAIPLLAAALTSDPVLVAGLAATHAAVRLLVVVPVGVYVDRQSSETTRSAPSCGAYRSWQRC